MDRPSTSALRFLSPARRSGAAPVARSCGEDRAARNRANEPFLCVEQTQNLGLCLPRNHGARRNQRGGPRGGRGDRVAERNARRTLSRAQAGNTAAQNEQRRTPLSGISFRSFLPEPISGTTAELAEPEASVTG